MAVHQARRLYISGTGEWESSKSHVIDETDATNVNHQNLCLGVRVLWFGFENQMFLAGAIIPKTPHISDNGEWGSSKYHVINETDANI